MPGLPTGTVTFLFTDIEGSTRRWEEHPRQMKPALERHDAILREAIESNGGFVFKTIGDAFCAAFGTAPQALAAAVAAQRALNAEPWAPEIAPLRDRMALHTGAAEERNGDYPGPTFDRTNRLLPAAYGGQVVVTLATEELLRDQLPAGIQLLDMGERRLRDLTHKEHVFQLVVEGLPSEFPPLKTLEGRPNNLPARPTPLVGREKEVGECLALLRRPEVRLLTLTGPGGIGKTRLALQVAARMLDDFEDGVFGVGLNAVTDPDLLVPTIAQDLAVREAVGRRMIDSLKDYLRDKQMLLLLDNFEQLVEAAPLLWELLSAARQLKILVTSRAVLHLSAEQEYQVPPLALPDTATASSPEQIETFEAVALFVGRAQAIRPDFKVTRENARAIVEICQRLEGLPLAIELAAARIKILPPQAMLSRLDSRLKLLTGGGRDMPARQQTMRATIEWSYDLLEEDEKVLFRRLAVFPGGATLEEAESVCTDFGLPIPDFPPTGAQPQHTDEAATLAPLEIDLLDGVASLMNKSLLRQVTDGSGEARFRMLLMIEEYAIERLAESGESDIMRRRHAMFYLALAEEAEPELGKVHQVEWLDRLENEHENLRAALEWANEKREAHVGLRLAAALWRFWYIRSHFAEGRRWLMALLGLPEGQGTTQERARALNGAGNLVYSQGDYDAARALHEESLRISRELGDKKGSASSLNNLGLIARHLGEYEGARSLFEQALEINRALKNRTFEAINLNNLANTIRDQGDLASARSTQEDSFALFTTLGDKWGMAMSLLDLGNVVLDQADFEMARTLYRRSLEYRRDLGDKRGIASTLMAIGLAAWKQGDYETAHTLFDQALEVFRDLGDKKGAADCLNFLGNVALYQGDHDTAASLYKESLSIRRELGETRDLAASFNNLGLLAIGQKEYDKAQEHLETAVALWREVGDKERISTSLSNLGRAVMYKGDFEEAQEIFRQSLALSDEVGDKWSRAYALSGLGQMALRMADASRARELFQESLKLRHELGDKRGVARGLMGMARESWAEGDGERAVKLSGAADTIMQTIGIEIEPAYRGDYEAVLNQAHKKLGEEVYSHAFQSGRAMSIDQAVDYALNHARPKKP